MKVASDCFKLNMNKKLCIILTDLISINHTCNNLKILMGFIREKK
jgi:hypothetical protein